MLPGSRSPIHSVITAKKGTVLALSVVSSGQNQEKLKVELII